MISIFYKYRIVMKPNFNFKFYQEYRLISFIIVLYLITNYLVLIIGNFLDSQELIYNRFYPATVLLALIFGTINVFLHRIPSLWKLLMKVPLIRGCYQGEIYFVINGEKKKKKCKMKIHQTASKIKVDTLFWNEDKKGNKVITSETISESSVEDLFRNERDNYELHFFYSNGGSLDSIIPIKMGYNVLKYDAVTKVFEGIYFSRNSIAEGNGGKIKLEFKKKI